MGYNPWGCKESDATEHACTHTHLFFCFLVFFCSMKLLSAEKKGDIQYQKEFKETQPKSPVLM